jgi:hypothetical protein
MRRVMHVLAMAFAMLLTLGLAGPAQAGPAHPVPIRGTLVGTEVGYPADTWDMVPFAEAQEFVVGGVTYDCGEPAIELVLGSYVGQFAHLGRTTLDNWICNAVDWTTGEMYVAAAEIVLTAANGDTLILVADGEVVLGDLVDGYIDFVAPFAFASGTGRFAHASGTLVELGRSSFPPFPAGSDPWVRDLVGTFSGEISYDASDRAAT